MLFDLIMGRYSIHLLSIGSNTGKGLTHPQISFSWTPHSQRRLPVACLHPLDAKSLRGLLKLLGVLTKQERK